MSLEKDVWIFPIYKYGSKKYIPLIYALPLAYIIPTLTIILLSPFAYNNTIIFQMEYIFIAFFFGFVGVLTRSKLRSFLNFIPAVLSYFTIEFFIQGVINFNPPLANPYGAFNVLKEPVESIITNLGIQGLDGISGVFIAIDVILILLIAQIGGFFLSVLSTGFWNPKGEFGILSIFSKLIAIPFVLMIIIALPIMLHAGGSIAGGIAYMGAGAVELQGVIGGGGQSAQFELGNLDIDDLRARSKRASDFFSIANSKFAQVKGNIFVGAAVSQIVNSNPEYKSFENITSILDVVGSVSEVTFVLPELMLGFNSLTKGFENTLGIITGTESTTYNPLFNDGLMQLNYAFGNFSKAWNTTDESGQQRGLLKAIQIASTLKEIEALNDFININQFVDALNKAVTTLLSLDQAFVQFLNGTYKVTIGLTYLSNNDLALADQWLGDGLIDFSASKLALDAVPRPGPVNFTIYSGGTPTVIEIPIDGVINIARDLNALLVPFGFGAKEGIQLFIAMDSALTSMDALNWTNPNEISDQSYWDGITNDLTAAQGFFDLAFGNISEAASIANDLKDNSYGSLLDPVFVDGETAFFDQLSAQVIEFKGNLTDFNFMLQGFANTTFAFRDYSLGTGEFNSWYVLYNQTSGVTHNITALTNAASLFNSSQEFAKGGYAVIGLASGINAEVKSNWQGMLYNPLDDYDNTTINGVAKSFEDLANTLISTPVDDPSFLLIMALIEQYQMGEILGSP